MLLCHVMKHHHDVSDLILVTNAQLYFSNTDLTAKQWHSQGWTWQGLGPHKVLLCSASEIEKN